MIEDETRTHATQPERGEEQEVRRAAGVDDVEVRSRHAASEAADAAQRGQVLERVVDRPAARRRLVAMDRYAVELISADSRSRIFASGRSRSRRSRLRPAPGSGSRRADRTEPARSGAGSGPRRPSLSPRSGRAPILDDASRRGRSLDARARPRSRAAALVLDASRRAGRHQSATSRGSACHHPAPPGTRGIPRTSAAAAGVSR